MSEFKIDPIMEKFILFDHEKERLNPGYKDPWFTFHEFYTWIANHKDFTKFIELGVWKGQSISYLANLLKDRKELELYGVDLWKETIPAYSYFKKDTEILYEIYNYKLKKTNTRHLITDITGCSWKVAEKFPDNYFDFIFIDAGNFYEEFKNNIKA